MVKLRVDEETRNVNSDSKSTKVDLDKKSSEEALTESSDRKKRFSLSSSPWNLRKHLHFSQPKPRDLNNNNNNKNNNNNSNNNNDAISDFNKNKNNFNNNNNNKTDKDKSTMKDETTAIEVSENINNNNDNINNNNNNINNNINNINNANNNNNNSSKSNKKLDSTISRKFFTLFQPKQPSSPPTQHSNGTRTRQKSVDFHRNLLTSSGNPPSSPSSPSSFSPSSSFFSHTLTPPSRKRKSRMWVVKRRLLGGSDTLSPPKLREDFRASKPELGLGVVERGNTFADEHESSVDQAQPNGSLSRKNQPQQPQQPPFQQLQQQKPIQPHQLNQPQQSHQTHQPHQLSQPHQPHQLSQPHQPLEARPHEPQRPHFVIVAIDFGTTYSGYAFSFVRDPTSVHIMRKWEGEDPGLVNQKTSTCLLLHPDTSFHSFGFTARDTYHDLDPRLSRQWLFFDKFKMTLHLDADLNEQTTIRAANGVSHPASSVFTHALHYFRNHALQELSDQSETAIFSDDVRWVITVPAIWRGPAKQFMRRAAYRAGIGSENNPGQLLIALEPEAASIYVRNLKNYQLVTPLSPLPPHSTLPSPSLPNHSETASLNSASIHGDNHYNSLPSKSFSNTSTVGQQVGRSGTRYMVVDCGGGTVDITVHEVDGSSLREIHKAVGGPYGSIGIDQEFEKLLCNIFHTDFIQSYKVTHPAGWVDLMASWEARKRSATPCKKHPYNIALPFSFVKNYRKVRGGSVEWAVKRSGVSGVKWSDQGMLRMEAEVMRNLFKTCLSHIRDAVGDVINNPSSRGLQYLFLVGGFAESELLQEKMKEEFGGLLRVVIPQDVSTTIMKGAVLFGLDPGVVVERRSGLTYGVAVLNKFIPGTHPQEKALEKDGVVWCRDVFDVFVTVDQPVCPGERVVRTYSAAEQSQEGCVVAIYSSDKQKVHYVDEAGVVRCGCLWLEWDNGGGGGNVNGEVDGGDGENKTEISSKDEGFKTDVRWRDEHSDITRDGEKKMEEKREKKEINKQADRKRKEVQASMTFGDTEISVDAVDMTTGACVKATIDFLGR